MSTLVVFVVVVWILSRFLGVSLRRIVRTVITVGAIGLYIAARVLAQIVLFGLIILIILVLFAGFMIIRRILRSMR